jgi:hypothetical protein
MAEESSLVATKMRPHAGKLPNSALNLDISRLIRH